MKKEGRLKRAAFIFLAISSESQLHGQLVDGGLGAAYLMQRFVFLQLTHKQLVVKGEKRLQDLENIICLVESIDEDGAFCNVVECSTILQLEQVDQLVGLEI